MCEPRERVLRGPSLESSQERCCLSDGEYPVDPPDELPEASLPTNSWREVQADWLEVLRGNVRRKINQLEGRVSVSDGSFMERLPRTVTGQASVSVITEGPHKLSKETPHKVITESPNRLFFEDMRHDGPHQLTAENLHQIDVEAPCKLIIEDLRHTATDRALTASVGEQNLSVPVTPGDHIEPYYIISDVICHAKCDVNSVLQASNPEMTVTSGFLDSGTESSGSSYDGSPSDSPEPSIIGGPTEQGGHSLVVVHLQPDADGRYGFNVKGGAGTSSPVTVSKVAPHTAAHAATPRLSEGDQLVRINGVDVSNFTHDEVVSLIKSCRQLHHQLVLTVKPSVNYEGGGYDLEEPLVRFVPDSSPHVSLSSLSDASPLAQSIAALADAVNSGAARLEFEKLARRTSGLTMDDCRLPHNLAKNRYRDISPYDCSRVRLCTAESGDYINANHVTMEIPGSGVVNRYIAAQGPLKHTTDDFWAMVWEQQCPLVVMLTTLVEQGRVKCHQYWPPVGETRLHADLEVSCTSEQVTESFAFRQITLVSLQTSEERHITHMQYVSWPDHGVPDQASDFVQFVQRVRAARAGLVEPTVVHCSAGIGRTGVLILMETAMCLIEANQPVRPLQLVDKMRSQRAMMVQDHCEWMERIPTWDYKSWSQFQFVCQAVVQVYEEGTVRPLDEYRQS